MSYSFTQHLTTLITFIVLVFLLSLLLLFQLITGVLLACFYIPLLGIAFTSVDYAIRDVAIG
jgi:quinol-cytochrome oxidoreductase complex cytochrome b subunit